MCLSLSFSACQRKNETKASGKEEGRRRKLMIFLFLLLLLFQLIPRQKKGKTDIFFPAEIDGYIAFVLDQLKWKYISRKIANNRFIIVLE